MTSSRKGSTASSAALSRATRPRSRPAGSFLAEGDLGAPLADDSSAGDTEREAGDDVNELPGQAVEAVDAPTPGPHRATDLPLHKLTRKGSQRSSSRGISSRSLLARATEQRQSSRAGSTIARNDSVISAGSAFDVMSSAASQPNVDELEDVAVRLVEAVEDMVPTKEVGDTKAKGLQKDMAAVMDNSVAALSASMIQANSYAGKAEAACKQAQAVRDDHAARENPPLT